MLVGPALLQDRRHVHAALVRERAHSYVWQARVGRDIRHLADETGQRSEAGQFLDVRFNLHLEHEAGYH